MGKAKLVYWLIQFTGWGLFIALLGLIQYIEGELNAQVIYQLLFNFFLVIFITHLIRYVLLYFDLVNMKIIQLLPRILLVTFSGSIFISLGMLTFVQLTGEKVEVNTDFWINYIVNSLVYTVFLLMWSSVYLTYHLIQKNRRQELLNLELKTAQVESELKTLRSQLNPHFLFNSLNSIRALIEIEPGEAKKAVGQLSNVLRSSLKLGKSDLVSLSDELKLVSDYLNIEKIRFDERLNYEIKNNNPKDWRIPPFCIQTLAENAIKHGISELKEGGNIIIDIAGNETKLKIKVENTGTLKHHKSDTQIGLENIKRRLKLHFGENAKFDIVQNENKVEASIEIKS